MSNEQELQTIINMLTITNADNPTRLRAAGLSLIRLAEKVEEEE